MSITITLPTDIAERLEEVPANERSAFAVNAIAQALEARRRDAQECLAAVEQALADMEEGRNLIPFEDLCRQWDTETAGRAP